MVNKLRQLLSNSLVIVIILFCHQAYSDEMTVDKVFQRLSSMANHTGAFTQTKILTGLSFPIISHGRFVFGKSVGLYNEIKKPLFQAATYSSTGIIEWDENGRPISTHSDNPAGQYVSEMLLAFFNGDKKHIREIFKINMTPEEDDEWHLNLEPEKAAISEYILEITISGKTHIRKIEVQAKNGDKTIIAFSDITEIDNLKNYCHYFPQTFPTSCNN